MKHITKSFILLLPALAFGCSIPSGERVGDSSELVEYVDTRIGTQAWKGPSNLSTPEEPMGFVYPGVGVTHPMIQLSPQTAKTDRCYFSHHPYIQGFRASHYPNGTSMSEYGSFTITPTTGELRERIHERQSSYSHDREVAKPYYYSVMLDDYDIKAELTGISKSGYLRFTYPESEQSHIIIDNARSEFENYYHVIPERNEIEGYVTNAGRVGNQGYTGREFACYYVARFSKPFESYRILPEPVYADNTLLVTDGFKGEIFDNPDFEGKPTVVRRDSDINFEWGKSPAPGVPEDHFSVRYTGTLKARKSGKHVLYLISDDYSRMSVNGKMVIDTRKTHRPAPELYSVTLDEGETCDMMVEYVDNTGLATLRFACIEPESLSAEQLSRMAEKGSVASAVSVTFGTHEGEVVDVKVGTSFIDFNQARKNLESEIGAKDFDRIVKQVKQVWEKEVGRIQVEASETDKQIFYTAMQRIALTPRNITEDGYHYSAFNGKTVPGIMYTDYSLWDTFRALHPLLIILTPEIVPDMITGLLNSYDEGGWIPKWPSPGYSNIMHGTHGDAVIADAYIKGIRGFDLDKALEAMMKNATTPGTGIYKARVGIEDYIKLGYVPTDRQKESVERTMEFSYDDFCIARMAEGMGRKDLSDELMKRSKNYLNVLDPQTKLIRGRNSDGSWRDTYDPAVSVWAQGTERDCETYYRNITFFAPHDVPGLIDFMGGPQELEKQLDYFFANEFYYVGDEFSMHSPYLYNYTGSPWKTQQTIRKLVKENFTNGLGGLPGNEDCGQLSAWYIFGVLGFYPVCPGTLIYQIGSPAFDKATINLPDGKTFVIEARNNSSGNVYIQSASLNGEPYSRCWLHHDDIMSGGTLVFEMGPEPNKEWGVL